MAPVVHPGRLLKRELNARALSANRLALDIGVPSGRITDVLNGRRSITADTAVRLGRYFGNSARGDRVAVFIDHVRRMNVEAGGAESQPASSSSSILRRPTFSARWRSGTTWRRLKA